MKQSLLIRMVLCTAVALVLSTLALARPRPTTRPAITPPNLSLSWKLAFIRDGNIWVANGDGSGQKLIIKDGAAPAWSPDKKFIAFARNNNIWVANAEGANQRKMTSLWQDKKLDYVLEKPIDISWEPTNRLITFSHQDIFQVIRENDKKSASIEGASIYTVPFEPTKEDGVEQFLGLADEQAPFGFTNMSHPAWSKSGKRLAFACNGDIWIAKRQISMGEHDWPWTRLTLTAWGWDIERLATVAHYDRRTSGADTENYAATHFSWSPDERFLAYDYQRVTGSGVEEIHLLDLKTGKNLLLLPKASQVIGTSLNPCFSPDGRWIAYNRYWQGDSSISIWAISPDRKHNRKIIENAEQPTW